MLTFQDLYEAYATDVYRFALWLSGDKLDAEDITSEMFIRAWVRNGSIRTETLKAYLFTIARNVYLEQRRKRKDHVNMVLDDIYPDPGPQPDKVVESQLELKEVQRILQTMPEIDRVAFILRVQQELPYTEIARALELSLSAAKVKVHRVRKKLIAEFVDKEVH
jgi:RNA polymerase sigma-70 factor (ECF subfamily)